MNQAKIEARRNNYETRDNVLKLLSDDEVASVSTGETAANLSQGEEYIDLEDLRGGVRRSLGPSAPLAQLLRRNSVHADTWTKILTVLKNQSW